MLVGDTVTKAFRIEGAFVTLPGRVVYIHPQRRFYTVEFTVGERTFRETYRYK